MQLQGCYECSYCNGCLGVGWFFSMLLSYLKLLVDFSLLLCGC